MKLRMIFALLVSLTAFIGASASAQQLPGNISLGGVPNGYYDGYLWAIGGIQVRMYYSAFLPERPHYNYTAALISNPLIGNVPNCGGNGTEWKYGNLDLWITQKQKIDNKWVDVVVWRRCTTSTQIWPPTGEQLIFSQYPGSFRPVRNSTKGEWKFDATLILPRPSGVQSQSLPKAREWTIWQ